MGDKSGVKPVLLQDCNLRTVHRGFAFHLLRIYQESVLTFWRTFSSHCRLCWFTDLSGCKLKYPLFSQTKLFSVHLCFQPLRLLPPALKKILFVLPRLTHVALGSSTGWAGSLSGLSYQSSSQYGGVKIPRPSPSVGIKSLLLPHLLMSIDQSKSFGQAQRKCRMLGVVIHGEAIIPIIYHTEYLYSILKIISHILLRLRICLISYTEP
ncbi:uncharacterized protein LOC123608390 [Leopardus geoffroyi]|uniref:uncharacterized protein LOC123608390 n=1 Tax=Leopardus geoffroyi TaxID=46844 RepID=UPI001E264F0E|nr:uncharacterized protein LOC123608390 [Leopardus geoffroyi]